MARRATGQFMGGFEYPSGPNEMSLLDMDDVKQYLEDVITGKVAGRGAERIRNAIRGGLRDPESFGNLLGEVGFGGITQMPRQAVRKLADELMSKAETGATIDVATGAPVTEGFMLGRGEGTELLLPPGGGAEEVTQFLKETTPYDIGAPGTRLGIWPGEEGLFVDIPEQITGPQLQRLHEGRMKLARSNERAAFDIETGKEILRPPGEIITGATHRAYDPLTELDVAMAGSNRGLRGAERARAGAPYFAPPKGYLGVPGQYRGEPGLGPEFHTTDLFGIFNPKTQPEEYQQLMRELDETMRSMGVTDQMTRATLMEKALIDKGYSGTVNPGSGVVSVFENVPLQYGGRLQGPFLGPQYGLLGGMEGAPRLGEMPATALREQRFARQRERQGELFPVSLPPETPAPRLPETRKRGTRTTVIRPERKAFPGIYQAEEDILEQAQRQWQPESENLRTVFGVSRADVDEAFREMERAAGSRGQVFAPTTARAADYPRQVMGEANTRRLRNILGMAGEDPQFAGAYGWYWNEPLRQRYHELLGPEEGERQFRRFHQQGAALSPGSAVPQEIERASIYNMLSRGGDPGAFLSGSELPAGAGHIYHTGVHKTALERALARGTPFETDPLQAAKTKAYYGARTGENVWSPIMDAHFVRGIGLSDVRPTTKSLDPGASIGEREAGRIADWYARQVAQPVGMGGVGAQALQWNVLGPQTGVKSPLGAPLMEIMADLAARKAQATGQAPRDVLDQFILGRGDLFTPR